MAETMKAELARAKASGEELAKHGVATGVVYDAARNRLIITLSTGIEIMFDPHRAQGFENATPADLATGEIEGAGLSIHFPTLDAEIYIPALLRGVMGTKKWMAAQLGAAGGKSTSEAKAAAARENGKRGGRPAVRA
jgi:hypothetical protein